MGRWVVYSRGSLEPRKTLTRMGNLPPGGGGPGGPGGGFPPGFPGLPGQKRDKDGDKDKKKRRFDPKPPSRVGRKRRKRGLAPSTRIPKGGWRNWSWGVARMTCARAVAPSVKCKLRLLKLERIKDFLLIEEEFIKNQEIMKPKEEKEQV